MFPFEVCVCNDASSDDTKYLLNIWKVKFNDSNILLKVYDNDTGVAGGGTCMKFSKVNFSNIYVLVGYAKNRAVSISSGKYLCFQDVVC